MRPTPALKLKISDFFKNCGSIVPAVNQHGALLFHFFVVRANSLYEIQQRGSIGWHTVVWPACEMELCSGMSRNRAVRVLVTTEILENNSSHYFWLRVGSYQEA